MGLDHGLGGGSSWSCLSPAAGIGAMAHHACTALRLRLRLRLLQLTGSCGLVQQRSDRHRADAPRSGGDVAAAPLAP